MFTITLFADSAMDYNSNLIPNEIIVAMNGTVIADVDLIVSTDDVLEGTEDFVARVTQSSADMLSAMYPGIGLPYPIIILINDSVDGKLVVIIT